MILRKCTGHLILGLVALLVGGGAQAQLSITNFEFSSVAVDYPADPNAANPMSLQGSLGQTMVTVDPPTNTGQNLAFLGFWETGVKFRYIGQVALEDFTGNLAGKPLEIRFWNTEEENNDTVITMLDGSGNFVADTWMNPSFVAGMSAKTPSNLRRKVAPTIPSDPLAYPSANFTGLGAELKAGDANNDNGVDVFDLAVLIESFDAIAGDPNWNDGAADFNGDGGVDVFDLDLLIRNFDLLGDE